MRTDFPLRQTLFKRYPLELRVVVVTSGPKADFGLQIPMMVWPPQVLPPFPSQLPGLHAGWSVTVRTLLAPGLTMTTEVLKGRSWDTTLLRFPLVIHRTASLKAR